MTKPTVTEAERQVATMLCRLLNLRERDRANIAPECSDIKLHLAELDLKRAEQKLKTLGELL